MLTPGATIGILGGGQLGAHVGDGPARLASSLTYFRRVRTSWPQRLRGAHGRAK